MAKQASKQKKPLTPEERLHKKNRVLWTMVYILIGILLVGGASLVLREYFLFPEKYTPPAPPTPAVSASPTPTPNPSAKPTPTPRPTVYVKPTPIRIYFDAHQLQADIYPVGLVDGNTIDSLDSATDAAWFDVGAAPGEPGNAIINGHVRWKGKKGTFSILKEMELGELVIIEFEDGMVRYFEVVSNDMFALDDFPAHVTDLDGDTRLTLITCKGDYDRSLGTSRTRVVVVCKEVPAPVETPEVVE